MNSVPQYRAAIGCYAPIAQNAQNMHKLRQTLHVTELYDSYDHMIHIYAKLLRHMIIHLQAYMNMSSMLVLG